MYRKKIAEEKSDIFSSDELAALAIAEEEHRQESIAEENAKSAAEPAEELSIKDVLRNAFLDNKIGSLSIGQLAQAIELIFNIEPVESEAIINNQEMVKHEYSEALMAENILINSKTRLIIIDQLNKYLKFKIFIEKEHPDLWVKMQEIYFGEMKFSELTEEELRLLNFLLKEVFTVLPVIDKKSPQSAGFSFADEQDKLNFIQKIDNHLLNRGNKQGLLLEQKLDELLELLRNKKIQKVLAILKKMETEELLDISRKIFTLPDSLEAGKLLNYINNILENSQPV